MKRNSGILLPIFSLPSKYGIGDFGKSAYKFVDYLKKAGQSFWQILPLVQTGYGNSPYSSISSHSLNPYFISPEVLLEKGLVTKEEVNFSLYDGKYIDYGFLYSVRFPLLRRAFERFDCNAADFKKFLSDKTAYDYALYMALKYASGQKHFYEWDNFYKYRNVEALSRFANDYKDELLFWQFVQFEAKCEWQKLKDYANSKGISIIGDLPLYVALDSVDVWQNPQLFKIDDNFKPKKVAGVPPDYFCRDGQLWGNPVYDYDKQKKDGFKWWTNRIKDALKLYDYIRIDHFRGLDRYYEIDADAINAIKGEWVDVPSDELFKAIHKEVDKTKIIAEDLGIIDDGVRLLMKKTGYPGMKILSFAFNGDLNNLYLPENIEENSVCYTGTHDNDTFMGLLTNASEWDYNNMVRGVENSLLIANIEGATDSKENILSSVIELGLNTKAKLFIIPMQDILKKGSDYRINEPGTVKPQNWAVKFSDDDFKDDIAKKLKTLTVKYKRNR